MDALRKITDYILNGYFGSNAPEMWSQEKSLSDGRINQNNGNNKMHEDHAGSSWKGVRMERNVVITGWSDGGQRGEWKPKIGAAV